MLIIHYTSYVKMCAYVKMPVYYKYVKNIWHYYSINCITSYILYSCVNPLTM